MSATADIQTETVANVVAVPIQSVTTRSAGGLTSDEVEQKRGEEGGPGEVGRRPADGVSGRASARRDRDLEQRVLFVKPGDKVKLPAVETGIADNSWIEIKHGAQAGDEVVSGTYAAISRLLKDGSPVTLEKPKPRAHGRAMIPPVAPSAATRLHRPAGPLVIAIEGVSKLYHMGEETVHALRGVTLSIHRNEYLAVTGALEARASRRS